MLSIPPATTRPESPRRIAWSASMTALSPEPQTLLTVVAPTDVGSPAKIAACRAGFWPIPAETTLPMMTSSTRSPGTPDRARSALMQVAPSCGAATEASAPPRAPIGVRTPATIRVPVVSMSMTPRQVQAPSRRKNLRAV